jgi:hypothetical protein
VERILTETLPFGRLSKGRVAQPVDLAHRAPAGRERLLRADDDAAGVGVELHHVERVGKPADPEAAALADRVVDHAPVLAEDIAVHVHDLAGIRRAGAQLLDHGGIIAVRHEADVLAVGLVGHGSPYFAASARVSALDARWPSGKRRKSSCSCVVEKRK